MARIRELKDWCIDCVFLKTGRYYVSRTKVPTPSQCADCMYAKFRTKKVAMPPNFRRGKGKVRPKFNPSMRDINAE